ncbi:integrase [Gossypium australe]|uniref:Integrase n=1 Tax=Gossypium australe TaxID=47621 RepID=A0A5B6W7B5_9ROSI|nr:integrase [Gossypium australe]
MDFVSGLPLTPTKKESIWVIVGILAKSTHFLPVCTNYSLQKLAKLYISKIVRLHGVHVLIISTCDPCFTSRFCMKLYEILGTRLDFGTTFHLQADEEVGRRIYHWLNLCTIIVSSRAYKWHFMKLCMVVSVRNHCVRLSWVKGKFWVLSWYRILRGKFD